MLRIIFSIIFSFYATLLVHRIQYVIKKGKRKDGKGKKGEREKFYFSIQTDKIKCG